MHIDFEGEGPLAPEIAALVRSVRVAAGATPLSVADPVIDTSAILASETRTSRVRLGGERIATISVALHEPEPVRLIVDSDDTGRFPFELSDPDATRKAPPIERMRIAFSGGTGDRRLRMTMKTIAELKRRAIPVETICVGEAGIAAIAAGYEFPELRAGELTSLLLTSTLFLEPILEGEGETGLAHLAAALGVPLVTHASASPCLLAHPPAIAVEEWSGDAFADAIAMRPARQSADRVASPFAGALWKVLRHGEA
ncbi:MAG TPA: hypothetical protein VMT00_01545 [Thermoanaerobaculia bacterium]|nr:hypothetical protein [Thermoanaerobaculia bacterium]